jgi:DNA-binding transcriptional MocR family regulator
MAARRRTHAVRWADATGALVVEDDYDGEFRYDRQAVGAMQALAPHRDEDETVERARTRGLALEGLGAFGPRDAQRGPALVIGYGTPPAHAFTTALARLAAALASLP